MSWYRNRAISVAAVTVGLAAMLGGSLGIAVAGFKPDLAQGVNPAVGGPLSADVPPGDFVGCLPATAWKGMYIFDSATQRWEHHFNTQGAGAVPAYVNNVQAGGIDIIPRFSGLVLIMNQAVENPFLRDFPNQDCPE
jgi:hypothetical protein